MAIGRLTLKKKEGISSGGKETWFKPRLYSTQALSPLEEPLGPGALGSDVMIEYHCVLGHQVLVTRRAGMASAFPKHNQAAAGQGGWEIGCKWKFFSSGLWGRRYAGHPWFYGEPEVTARGEVHALGGLRALMKSWLKQCPDLGDPGVPITKIFRPQPHTPSLLGPILVSKPPSASEAWTKRNSLPFPWLTGFRVPSETFPYLRTK